ncbi:Nephrocystin-3-like protein [Cladobotryum mycophilum]|uniref:Nephrocystin-3-like protein n=1 Tax=Cladobotryum mycophilum TaxID=491253 RepID=A0ABR0S494_9HYPO
MEGAIVDLSLKVTGLCLRYAKDVKDAGIERLGKEINHLMEAAKGVQESINASHGIKLDKSQKLDDAIRNSHSQLEELHEKLELRKSLRLLSKARLLPLKWPFQRYQVDRFIQDIRQNTDIISLALQMDQTRTVPKVNQNVTRIDQDSGFQTGDGSLVEQSPTGLQHAQSTAESEDTRIEEPKQGTTFRVCGVPIDWDNKKLQSFLADQRIIDMEIESLALEANAGSQTATLMFQTMPSQLQHNPNLSISLPKALNAQLAGKQYLTFGKDFLGITTLFAPPWRTTNIIALSGLGGHAFGSFKERGGSHMWLRDSLPYDLTSETSSKPMARVMIYGHESTVANSQSMQNLEDLATGFHASLNTLANAATMRPIILIGHSLGGLIIKQALISLSRSEIEGDKKLIRAIYGVVFFGTPHDGMDISSLIPMAGDGPNRFLLESLNRINSQILGIQQRDFHKALGDKGQSEVFCFYETRLSPTAEEDGGKWKMTGPPAVLVAKASATHCRPWEDGPEHICAINRTHSEMVKFRPDDSDYRNVLEKMKALSKQAFTVRDRLQTSSSKYIIPYSQNIAFVGRLEILRNLKEQFGLGQQLGPVPPRRRVSLYGLGGAGKTQIALAYVYWLQKTCPNVSVFWVHASNADRFYDSYASIAKMCNVPEWNDPNANMLLLVKRWLEEQNKMQWLMVIDNADDTELFFPAQQKQDILTGETGECENWHQAGPRKAPIEIGTMTDSEADQLVRAVLGDRISTTDETSPLSSRLEYLPLALAQAASFIQENRISISDYIQLLDESDSTFVDQLSEPFETVGRDSETPHAVTATWIISFDQIERQQASTSDILSFLSLFHFQGIPKDFVEDYYHRRDPRQTRGSMSATVIKELGTLKAFSFISEDKDKNISMHRLVHLVTQKWLINKGRMTEFARCAVEIMATSYPFGEFETHEICLRYLPHANAVLRKNGTDSEDGNIIASLLHNMAGYFSYKGEWKEAEDLGIQVMDIRKRVLGEEHPSTLTSMANLASTYSNQGRWKEAEDLGIQVMEISKRVLGEEHPYTLTIMANLALTYSNQGRWKEAEDLGIQVMEISKRVLGEEHPDTLTSMANLASTYWNQGRWKEAEDLGIQVMDIRKRVLGEEHPSTLTSMANLASTYSNQGRWKEAEDLGIQVMDIRKRVLGEEHPDTLTSMANLALTYRNQGRWKEAEDLEIQVMEIRKRVLGEEHPSTLTIMANLASTYWNQGRWKEAEDLGIQVMEISKRVLGEEHPDTLTSMANLALTYSNQGRWKEAEDLGIQVMEISKRVLGEEHPDTLTSMAILASTYSNQGRWKEAEDLGIQVMEIRKRVLGEEHPSTLTSMANLASTYWNQGRWKEAEDLEIQVMDIRKRVLGEEHPSTLTSMANLAFTWKSLGRLGDAMALMQDCASIREQRLGQNHPDTLFSLSIIDEWRRDA